MKKSRTLKSTRPLRFEQLEVLIAPGSLLPTAAVEAAETTQVDVAAGGDDNRQLLQRVVVHAELSETVAAPNMDPESLLSFVRDEVPGKLVHGRPAVSVRDAARTDQLMMQQASWVEPSCAPVSLLGAV